jgi:hypothetical protein
VHLELTRGRLGAGGFILLLPAVLLPAMLYSKGTAHHMHVLGRAVPKRAHPDLGIAGSGIHQHPVTTTSTRTPPATSDMI